MNKKKLLIVAHHLTIGGVQKSLISALKAIDYDKYDVTLYLRKNRTDLLSLVDERVNVIINDDKHHYYRKPYCVYLQILMAFYNLLGKKKKAEKINKKLSEKIVNYSMSYERKRFFSSDKYDIAVAYVQGYTALFVAECVSAEKKVVFFHTSVDELHHIHEKIIDKFYCAVAIHDEQKELIKEWYPEIKNKITIVENYCDKELIENQSKEFNVAKPEEKVVLCSCGRFTQVKGFNLAVEAAKILKDRHIPFIWYFVGDGPERDNIEALIKEYGLQEEIVITGMQKNPYPYMNACDIYVQPSYQDAMPLTLIEAKRLNKLIITTDTVGGRKLVDNKITGLVCEIDSSSIADSIECFVKNKELSDSVQTNLKNADYSDEFNKYKIQWQNLLEE